MNLRKILAIFFIFCSVLTLHAQQSKEDNITISFQKIPLSEAIKKIEDASKYTFFYDASKVNTNKSVSLSVTNEPIKQAITKMLDGTDIQYQVKNSQIILQSKGKVLKEDKIQVKGIVSDVNGEPLIGVNVRLKDNLAVGVISDMDGMYTISAPSNSTLVYDYIGFGQREEAVQNRAIINVVLRDDALNLDEVTIVAYGTQKKASVVAAITTVKPQQLGVSTTRSISNNLAGNIGGIIAVQRSGEPGYDNSEFWIRGMSSFQGQGSPLVLVDGVERSLNNLDIAEIESFSVLKDASASALYGVRGANGVIIITTKRGHAGKTTINVSAEHSITQPAKLPQFLNAANYLTLLNNINVQEKGTLLYSKNIIDKYRTGYDREIYPDVDWIDMITNDFANNTRASFDLAGGSEKLRYSFVGAYYREAGITVSDNTKDWDSDLSVNRFNLRTNVDMNITPSTLVTFNIGGYLQKRKSPTTGINEIFAAAFKATPYMHPAIYDNGLLPKPKENNNPWAMLTQTGFKREAESKLETLFAVEQDLRAILKGLKMKGIFSYDYFSANSVKRATSPRYYAPATGRDAITGALILDEVVSEGSESLGYEIGSDFGNHSTYIELNTTYDERFGDHTVSGLLLYNQREYDNGENVPYRTQGLAGRAAYTFKDRYIAEFNFGYNGSENLLKDKRYGFFPSFALGWIMSEEPFMQSMRKSLHKVKFRASYGLVGNDRFYRSGSEQWRFPYMTGIDETDGYKWGVSGSYYEKGGLREGNPGVPNLIWETVKKTNIGIELGLLNMIDLQLDLFHERREDIFLRRDNLPASVGIPVSPWANFGVVTNKGVDISLDINKQINKDWAVSARTSFTYAKNKIIERGEDLGVLGTYRSAVGKPVNQIFGLKNDGLFTENDFANLETGELKQGIPLHKFSGRVYPGDIKYQDLDGDGEITDLDKTAIGGTLNPELVYGFGLNVNYKSFDFGVFFQGNGRTYRVIGNGVKNFLPGSTIGAEGNIFKNASDAWTVNNQNQDVFYPRLHLGYNENNAQTSDWWLKDMSMLRLKNLELGYSLPQKMIRSAAMEYARVFVRGTNLFQLSKFKLWDPELDTNTGLAYPIMASYSVGFQVRF